MKRAAATSAYVRSWLPSVWKRALQRLLHFLLRLSLFPRRLLMLEGRGERDLGSGGLNRPQWLRAIGDETKDQHTETGGVQVEEADADSAFFAAATTIAPTTTRIGLTNTGNTCFVNAVVQCLLAIPGFVDRLEQEVLRASAQNPTSLFESTGSGDRDTRKHARLMELALSLLDLLQGLVPEDTDDTTQENGSDVGEARPLNYAASSDLKDERRVTGRGDQTENAMPVYATQTSGKKRKRSMRTNPGEYSSAATKKRLRSFLVAASKCSELVSAEPRRQDQQDAEELLLFLLDSLHEALKWPSKNVAGSEGLNHKNGAESSASRTADMLELGRLVELETQCLQRLTKCVVTDPTTYNTTVAFLSDVRWKRYLNDNSSLITEMFTGQTVRGSQCCSCANLTCLHQEFRVLSLSIDPSQGSHTLEGCLETHRRLEDLVADNQVFCDGHCQGKTSRRTQVLLQRAPPALIIQLQRFRQTSWQTNAEKIATPIEFPIRDPLDITHNMFLRDASHPVKYELQAVCAHVGSALDAGHYIAYARDDAPDDETPLREGNGNRWIKFDDDLVITLDEATLRMETQTTAYMLFYSQRQASKVFPDGRHDEDNTEHSSKGQDDCNI